MDVNEDTDVEGSADMASSDISGESADVASSDISGESSVRVKMLARVSLSDAHFKHQQRGEPDLTMDEKIDIAQKLLDESKSKFLSRFGEYLELEDLVYFRDSMDEYEVNFYVSQIKRNKMTNFNRYRVKNRRFQAMKELMMKGEYFSEDEMKYREPYLYEQMVGQYLSDNEIQAKIDKSDLRFSTILLKHIDQLSENARYEITKNREESQEEEEEDSDDENNDSANANMEEETDEMVLQNDHQNEEKPKLSTGQKEELRAEFLSLMQQKFLQGEDKTFDYNSIDNNEMYDDLDVLDIEAEEKYFDD